MQTFRILRSKYLKTRKKKKINKRLLFFWSIVIKRTTTLDRPVKVKFKLCLAIPNKVYKLDGFCSAIIDGNETGGWPTVNKLSLIGLFIVSIFN